MAEKKHVQHVRSKVVENGQAKLPLSSDLLFGEIAINYAKNCETISLKNESGDVITFHPDEIQVGTSGDTISASTKVFIDTEADDSVQVYTKDQVDSQVEAITAKDAEQDNRITALEDGIIISDVQPTSEGTELFVDTSNDGGNFEVYTKAQVDSMIAYLQRQIDELKN